MEQLRVGRKALEQAVSQRTSRSNSRKPDAFLTNHARSGWSSYTAALRRARVRVAGRAADLPRLVCDVAVASGRREEAKMMSKRKIRIKSPSANGETQGAEQVPPTCCRHLAGRALPKPATGKLSGVAPPYPLPAGRRQHVGRPAPRHQQPAGHDLNFQMRTKKKGRITPSR
jgi:hypothetical protein